MIISIAQMLCHYLLVFLVTHTGRVAGGTPQPNQWGWQPGPPPSSPFDSRHQPPDMNMANNMPPPWNNAATAGPTIESCGMKDTLRNVVKSCHSQLAGTRVGYMGPSGTDRNVSWVYDEKAFLTLLNSMKIADLQVKTTPSNGQFARLILQTIEAAKNYDPSHPNQLQAKEILIISDLDLALDQADADSIVTQQLATSHFHMRYLWLPTGNETSPWNMQDNSIDLIIDPMETPTYLKNLSQLSDDETVKQLAVCRLPHSTFMIQKSAPPGPPPQPPPGPPLQPPPQAPQPQPEPYDHSMPKPPPPPGNAKWVLPVAIAVGAIVLVMVVGVLCVVYSHTKLKWKANIEQIRSVAQRNSSVPNQYQELERHDEWTIRKGHLEIQYEQKLGAGAFCDVFKGKLIGQAPVCKIYPSVQASRSYVDCDVAVKMLPTFADDMARSDFVQEINFMKSLAYHPHLTCMLGVAWESLSEPRLVTEYCVHGDLLHFIRDKKDEILQGYSNINGLKLKDLVSYSWQIGDGLDYLHSKGCIHRDVAARNVLVDYTNTAKIADFGLCRLTERALYTSRGGRLPIKWMAPESLKSYEYSFKSDVWSFGVLLFELFSLGDVPFPCHQPADMLEHLETGNRLKQPSFCPNEIFKIMSQCWLAEPRDRPSFEVIRGEIAKILESATANYGYVQVEQTDDLEHNDTNN